MANYVVTATLQDGISDPANAAAAAMQNAAAAADQMTASVTKAGPSAQALVNRFDPLTNSTTAYSRAVAALTQAQATLSAGVAAGTITQAQANAALDGLGAKVTAARTAMANAVPTTTQLSAGMNAAAAAATSATVAHTSMYREVVVLADEMLRGNYSRIPGSMLEMASYSGQLDTIWGTLKTTAAALVSPLGLISIGAVAAGAALAVMGVSAEEQARQLNTLSNALLATRDDATAMATEVQAAAKLATNVPGSPSAADKVTAAQTIAAVPTFTGNTSQLGQLLALSGELAQVWQETLPQAAKTLASAMSDPGAEAEKLAQQSFPGMTQALADSIKSLADSGDQAGAFGQVLTVLQAQAGQTSNNLTPVQKALQDLSDAFTKTGADGKSFGQTIGDSVEGAAAMMIEAIAQMINATHGAVADAQKFLSNPTAGPTGAGDYAGATGNNTLTSSAGALGIFQLMPATAAGLHVNPNDASDNIYGGMAYLQQLQQQFGGNVPAMLAQYSGHGANVSGAAGYISSVSSADTSVLNGSNLMVGGQTMTVAQGIQYWGQTLGLSPDMIQLGMQIATVESGGHQYSTGGAIALPASAPSTAIGSQMLYSSAGAVGPFQGSGVTNTSDSVVNQALTSADKAGTSVASGQQAFEQIQLYDNALAQLAAQGDTSSQSVTELQQALQKAQVAFYNAQTPLDKLTTSVDLQIVGNQQVAAAWESGAGAADDATNKIKAQQQALTVAAPGTQAYTDAVTALTQAYDDLTASQQGIQAAQDVNSQQQQLAYLQAEQQTLGETAAQRAQDLAVLQEQQNIESKLPDIEAQQKQKLVDNAAAIADSTTALQQQQQALSELSNSFSSSFDTIGNAIAQAFIQGQGAAVNWANVMDSVIEQVIQEFLKLAVLNPVLNSLFGSNNTTLSGALAALGSAAGATTGTSGSSGSTSSITSLLSDASSLNTLGSALGLTGPGSLVGNLTDDLGLTGSNGLLSSLGLGGNGGIMSTITGLLDTPVLGTSALSSATNSALADLAAQGTLGPATPASLGLAGTTLGAAISGVGAGYGLGSLAGGYVQSALNKTGPAPDIGAGTGAIAGAAIGSIIPGIGTVLGGIIGGLIGGGGGGLIGPHPAGQWTSVPITTQNGMLAVGGPVDGGVPLAGDGQSVTSELQAEQQEIAQINSVLAAGGAQIVSTGGYNEVGTTGGGASLPSDKGSDISDIFSSFRFSSSDPTLNNLLANQSFGSLQDLQNVIQQYQAAQTAITSFLSTTAPQLEATATSGGSLAAAIAQINDQFNPAIQTAQTYAASQDASTAQVQQLTDAENSLTAARDQAIQTANNQATQQVDGYDQSFQAAYMSAQATVDGNPQEAESAQLYAFDASATQQQQQLQQELDALYGTAWETSAGYAQQMADLETSLGEQRLAIQTQYNNQLEATAEQGVSGLDQYLTSLEFGSSSPLSASDQYSLAQQQFNSDVSGAQAGNYSDFQNIQSDASTFLSASSNLYGSGEQYQQDQGAVIKAIQSVVGMGADALTNAVLTEQMQTQTQQLVAAISDGNTIATRLLQAIQQNAAAPARIGS